MHSGFGNHFATEAVHGALPQGRNSPQRPAYGLYAEQFSASAFTMARSENRRSWLYRLRPAAMHAHFVPVGETRPCLADVNPNRLRWDAPEPPLRGQDFQESLTPVLETLDGGIRFQLYASDRSMDRKALFYADSELLLLPVNGRIAIDTEFGKLEAEPQQILLIPRGCRFRVRFPDGQGIGYAIENLGAPFRLPDLGPIGANGLANPRDFLAPVAWYEDRDEPFELVQKCGAGWWRTMLDHSPFDVVAWHGNVTPYLYDLRCFNVMGTVSYDHPDPSIFTVLTSPSAVPGQANADFVIFPPRWMVGEDTFRPPWFHRNLMSEAMGLIHGAYDAKADGFRAGGISLHNRMNAHGPDVATWQAASQADLVPHKIADTMAFMIETYSPYRVVESALARSQPEYDHVWDGFPRAVLPPSG